MRTFSLIAATLFALGCSTPPAKPVETEKPVIVKPPAPKPAPEPAAAIIDRTPIKADVSKVKFLSEQAELFGYDDGESRAFFYTNGTGELAVKVPADGEYEILVTASCQAANGQNAKFKLKVDGAVVGAETQLKSEEAKDYAFTAPLKSGERKIAAEFTNDLYKEGEYDMNFFLNGLKLVRVK
jgi:hypothetical protein